jgi:cation transport regulator ChaC
MAPRPVSDDTAVFAYGSLVNTASFAQTLGRPVDTAEPARLHGWRRTWGLARDNAASEKTFALADGTRPRFCLGLDVVPDDDALAPNGALVAVTEAELERLDLREIRYERVDVTAQIDADAFDRVLTYRARAEHRCAEPPEGAVVVAAYLRAVDSAFDELGPGQLNLFRETTGPLQVEVVEATLVADRIPAGNPRDW